jgi:hypothetical protein
VVPIGSNGRGLLDLVTTALGSLYPEPWFRFAGSGLRFDAAKKSGINPRNWEKSQREAK